MDWLLLFRLALVGADFLGAFFVADFLVSDFGGGFFDALLLLEAFFVSLDDCFLVVEVVVVVALAFFVLADFDFFADGCCGCGCAALDSLCALSCARRAALAESIRKASCSNVLGFRFSLRLVTVSPSSAAVVGFK